MERDEPLLSCGGNDGQCDGMGMHGGNVITAQPFVANPSFVNPSAPPSQQQPSVTVQVLQQPNRVVVQQPRAWSSGTFACCDDVPTSFGVCFCTPCYMCHISSKLGENCMIPICCPGGIAALRQKIRLQNNITGSLCDDYCKASSCCLPCVLCQMKREIDHVEQVNACVM